MGTRGKCSVQVWISISLLVDKHISLSFPALLHVLHYIHRNSLVLAISDPSIRKYTPRNRSPCHCDAVKLPAGVLNTTTSWKLGHTLTEISNAETGWENERIPDGNRHMQQGRAGKSRFLCLGRWSSHAPINSILLIVLDRTLWTAPSLCLAAIKWTWGSA